MTVEVQNKLSQGVNVYVVQGGNKTFLRQVPPTARPGAGAGDRDGRHGRAEATLDGVKTYTRSNVTLTAISYFRSRSVELRLDAARPHGR